MGVAVRVSTSTDRRIFLRCSLCFTPKRCSSSMMSSPNFLKVTSFCNRRCVPITMSIAPEARPASAAFCSARDWKRLSTATRVGKASMRARKVS